MINNDQFSLRLHPDKFALIALEIHAARLIKIHCLDNENSIFQNMSLANLIKFFIVQRENRIFFVPTAATYTKKGR